MCRASFRRLDLKASVATVPRCRWSQVPAKGRESAQDSSKMYDEHFPILARLVVHQLLMRALLDQLALAEE